LNPENPEFRRFRQNPGTKKRRNSGFCMGLHGLVPEAEPLVIKLV
jgi:hypothetical protein